MLSVAMLSKWHVHAGDYARQVQEHPDLKLAAVWDEKADRGAEWAQSLGVPFYADLAELLANPEIDAVVVDAPSNIHRDVLVAAAKAGKHIFSEKVLALTTKECDEVFAAVDEAGVQLMLSLPRLTDSYYLYAQKALDEGLLGRLTSVRCRLAHNGGVPSEGRPFGWLPEHFYDPVECGGGALIDLGAHPIYLTNRLAGPAKAVTARFTNIIDRPVDDNSAVIVEYENGALGVLEVGFVSGGSPFLLEVHGTEGSVLIEDSQIRIRSQQAGGKWQTITDAPTAQSPMRQWVDAILRGTEPAILRDDMRRLTQINEVAALSNREGRRVLVQG